MSVSLPKTKSLKIIKICEENSIYYNVYTENGIIAKNLSYNTLYYYKDNLTKPDENRTHINIVENVYDYFEQREEKILKIMICDEHKTVFNSIVRKLKELSEIEVLEVSHMSRKIIKQGTDEIALEYFYTEVSAKDVDKWNALEEIIGLMNILSDEIPYFVGVFLFILFVRNSMGCSRYDPEFFGVRFCFIEWINHPCRYVCVLVSMNKKHGQFTFRHLLQ